MLAHGSVGVPRTSVSACAAVWQEAAALVQGGRPALQGGLAGDGGAGPLRLPPRHAGGGVEQRHPLAQAPPRGLQVRLPHARFRLCFRNVFNIFVPRRVVLGEFILRTDEIYPVFLRL